MKSDNIGSADSSAAASGKPPARPTDLSEADYLARQGEKAKAAMNRTTADMAQCLKNTASLPAWVSEYPWTSVAAAATVGFVAASALTPSRDESFKERFESLIEEVRSHPAVAAAAAPTMESEAKTRSMTGGLMAYLMDAVKTALVSTVSAAISAKVQQTQPPANGNGAGDTVQDLTSTI